MTLYIMTIDIMTLCIMALLWLLSMAKFDTNYNSIIMVIIIYDEVLFHH